jgi:predicted RNase H-like HicB family nuclease/predicted RNA binding protein YcfA (HicA-like mRNA interferase family)
MKYRVNLEKTDEGYAVWCPGLPGCWSQGATEEDALANIRDAIETYLLTVEELNKGKVTRLVEVPAWPMPKLPGISHQRAIKAFQKAGFWVVRQGKHISMTNGDRIIVIPRANPVDAFTMGGIIRDAGLTIEEFKNLLW